MTEKIAPATRIGGISLFVADAERAVRFYQDGLGFQILNRDGSEVTLGVGDQRLITLIEKPGARQLSEGPRRGATGLYHFAILLPERRALARLLYHLAENEIELQGASDHGVSEALYLSDPDGNGIELYRDRRRKEWPVDDIGKLMMNTDPLDVDDLIMELRDGVPPWQGLPEGTVIGHVHLHVRDLMEAELFYIRVLGFDSMQRYGSGALFVSAGGYHHHVGLNTWAGVGAPPPPEDAVGLRWFELLLPDADALQAARARIEAAGVSFQEQDGGLLLRDPSQNGILLKSLE